MGIHFFENGEPVLLDLQSTHEIIGQFRAALLPTMPRAGQARVTTCTPFILRVFLSVRHPSLPGAIRSFLRYVVSRAFLSMTYIYLPRGRGTPNPTIQPSEHHPTNGGDRDRPSADRLWQNAASPPMMYYGPHLSLPPLAFSLAPLLLIFLQGERKEESRVNFGQGLDKVRCSVFF